MLLMVVSWVVSSTNFHRALVFVMASLISIRNHNGAILITWGTPQVKY